MILRLSFLLDEFIKKTDTIDMIAMMLIVVKIDFGVYRLWGELILIESFILIYVKLFYIVFVLFTFDSLNLVI